MDELMALLAFVVAAMYVVIAFAVVPRLAHVELRQPRILRMARWGAMAFFTGCALTHVKIGVDALLGDSADMSEMATGSNPVPLLPHAAQIIGGGLFLLITRLHLEWSVLPTKVAEELHRGEIQLRSAFERAPVGMALIGVTGPDRGRILRANPALSALVHQPGTDLCGGSYRDLFVPSDQNDATAGMLALVRGDAVLDQELRLGGQDGRHTWVEVGVTMARDEGGEPLFGVAQIRDITDQRHTDTLHAAQHAVMQAVSGGDSLSAGLDQVLETVCAALGWAGGEYWQADTTRRGITRVTSWWSPSFAGYAIARTDDLALGRGQGVPGTVWAKGARVWIGDLSRRPDTFVRVREAQEAGLNAVIGLPIRSGGQSGVLMFFAPQMAEPDQELSTALEGISAHVGRFVERRRAEELLLLSGAQAEQSELDRIALAEERRRLRQAEAIGRVGSWEWDLTNNKMACSQALFELCGVEVTAAPDREIFGRCIHPDDVHALTAAVRACADSGEPFVHGYRVVRSDDGLVREIETRGERLPQVAGDPVRVAGMAMDVTDRVREQQDVQARQEMLLALIADTLVGWADSEADPVRADREIILGGINNVLDFSRLEAGRLELEDHPFDLRQCIDDGLALVRVSSVDLNLVADVDPACPRMIRGDSRRLRQVLVSLVGNAVKVSEPGLVVVTVTVTDPETLGGDSAARITPGSESIPIQGGSGSGLAISRALVQAMGGDLTVTSEVGIGSTFRFRLPPTRVISDPARRPADVRS